MTGFLTYFVLHLQNIYALVRMISKDMKNSLTATMVDCKNDVFTCTVSILCGITLFCSYTVFYGIPPEDTQGQQATSKSQTYEGAQIRPAVLSTHIPNM